MRVLKQSTAATVMFGAYVDKTDGVTAEVGLAGAGTELSKAGAAFGAGPTLGTHDSDGWYPISLTTTHTNTLGDLTIKGVDDATHLPVWMHFTVLSANAYDALVSGTGVGMRADVQGWLGTAPATPTTNGVPEVDLTHIAGSAVSTSTAQLGVNVVNAAGTAWASGAITAAVIATGAIDADALAADAVTEIRSLVSGTADSGTTTTMVDAARTEADDDYWKGKLILFTSGSISGQVRLITGFTASSDTITFAPATTQAVGTNTYEILPAGRADVELWDGSAVNALISGRVDANMQASGTGSITTATFAAGAIDNAAFNVTETLTANPATGGIVAASFGAGAIDAAAIATGAIDADAIASNAITSAKIAADAIGASQIADGAIDAGAIASSAITAAKFAAGAIDAAALATDAVNEIRDAILPKINTALSNIEFLMVDSTDHVTPKTGLTITATRSIDGGAFASATGTAAEVANGIYQFDASAADMNGTIITFRFTGTGADDTFLTIKTGG